MRNKIQWNDKVSYENDLYLLPAELQLAKIKTRPIGGGIGFQSKYLYIFTVLYPKAFIDFCWYRSNIVSFGGLQILFTTCCNFGRYRPKRLRAAAYLS